MDRYYMYTGRDQSPELQLNKGDIGLGKFFDRDMLHVTFARREVTFWIPDPNVGHFADILDVSDFIKGDGNINLFFMLYPFANKCDAEKIKNNTWVPFQLR